MQKSTLIIRNIFIYNREYISLDRLDELGDYKHPQPYRMCVSFYKMFNTVQERNFDIQKKILVT